MADTTREIPQEEWKEYFDDLGRAEPVPSIAVEVDGEEIGAQFESESAMLAAISYDDKDDVLVVGIGVDGDERAEHLIYGPRKVFAIEREGDPVVIDVEDAEGTRTVIKFGAS